MAGDTYRYSATADWQHGNRSGDASTRIVAYGIGYDLDLFSNFTFYLDDPVHGDQIEQADHRFITGVTATHRRLARWRGRSMMNTVGLQVRNDDITNVALYHTEARVRLDTRTQAAVVETGAGAFAQNETEWTPWLRTLAGARVDAVAISGERARYRRTAARLTPPGVSPKGGVTLGPWKGTEFYANGGFGFHSNDARGTTISEDPDGHAVNRVTPLVGARGAEVGVRTVAIRHLQSTLSVWTLHLDSELVFAGDEGTTEASGASARRGVEWTNYFSPRKWLIFDGDLSWSRARFTTQDPAGDFVPEAVGTVVSAGATVDAFRGVFGSLRWRYFGPRPLVAGRLGAIARHQPRESRGRLSRGPTHEARARPVQRPRRGGQRCRLFLYVPTARRAARRDRRRAHASHASAHRACDPRARLLSTNG